MVVSISVLVRVLDGVFFSFGRVLRTAIRKGSLFFGVATLKNWHPLVIMLRNTHRKRIYTMDLWKMIALKGAIPILNRSTPPVPLMYHASAPFIFVV